MSDTENEVFPASKLGEYTVLRDVAEGTFGKVKSMSLELSIVPHLILFLVAQHTVTGHIVAMKFISKAVTRREKNKNRVRREYEYMRTLRHPHVIKLCVFSPLITEIVSMIWL